jgi:glutaconate CoA-transferase subunit B
MGFDGETKRMELLSTHPGVTVEDVKANCGFELLVPNTPMVTEPPTDEELKILRTKIDPEGLVLGRR